MGSLVTSFSKMSRQSRTMTSDKVEAMKNELKNSEEGALWYLKRSFVISGVMLTLTGIFNVFATFELQRTKLQTLVGYYCLGLGCFILAFETGADVYGIQTYTYKFYSFLMILPGRAYFSFVAAGFAWG